jgi:hypothetical protein
MDKIVEADSDRIVQVGSNVTSNNILADIAKDLFEMELNAIVNSGSSRDKTDQDSDLMVNPSRDVSKPVPIWLVVS